MIGFALQRGFYIPLRRASGPPCLRGSPYFLCHSHLFAAHISVPMLPAPIVLRTAAMGRRRYPQIPLFSPGVLRIRQHEEHQRKQRGDRDIQPRPAEPFHRISNPHAHVSHGCHQNCNEKHREGLGGNEFPKFRFHESASLSCFFSRRARQFAMRFPSDSSPFYPPIIERYSARPEQCC